MEAYLGEIRLTASRVLPAGWARCLGQTLKISEYEALYALLGTTYGGDGKTTFGLPDLRGRVPIGTGTANNITYNRGVKVGTSAVSLNISQAPAHTHNMYVSNNEAVDSTPRNGSSMFGSFPDNMKFYVDSSYGDVTLVVDFSNSAISMAGNEVGHMNIMPSLGLYYMICTIGMWPNN